MAESIIHRRKLNCWSEGTFKDIAILSALGDLYCVPWLVHDGEWGFIKLVKHIVCADSRLFANYFNLSMRHNHARRLILVLV